MKKSVKILIIVLCLIIIGLVTFIVVDKVMNKRELTETSINDTENNSAKTDSSQNKDNVSSLNGTYVRADNTKRTSGYLVITNFNENSFDFEIEATHCNGPDIEYSIANGGVNIGGVSGSAKKISNEQYEFVPEEDDKIIEWFEGEYKIIFTKKSDNSFEIEEVYDKNNYSQGPYAGGNVRFDGIYESICFQF